MRKYIARFKSDLYNVKVAGPLYNVGLIGRERDTRGPMADFIKKSCVGQECFMTKQMKLLRYEIGKAKVLYDKIYDQFTEAIKDLEEIKVSDRETQEEKHEPYRHFEVSKKDSIHFLEGQAQKISWYICSFSST